MLNNKGFNTLQQLLQSTPLNIVVTTHHKPDGDALGSSLGWANILRQAGHKVQVVSPTDYPDFLFFLPGENEVIDFTKNPDKAKELVANADLICCLDFNRLERINELGELVKNSAAKKLLIDHHTEPEGFEDYTYCEIGCSSTAELIYLITVDLGWQQYINADVAMCIYTGIMTDTGSFRFDSTTPRVHEIIAALLRTGMNHTKVFEEIYDSYKYDRMRFLGYCLNHKLQLIPEYNTAYIALDADELRKYNIVTGDTEGIVNFPMSLRGIRLAALIIQRPNEVKLSLRSKGDVPVNEMCGKYFSGGGHKNASGGKSNKTLNEVVADFRNMLSNYQSVLQ